MTISLKSSSRETRATQGRSWPQDQRSPSRLFLTARFRKCGKPELPLCTEKTPRDTAPPYSLNLMPAAGKTITQVIPRDRR